MKDVSILLARICLAGIFLISGTKHILNFEETQAFMRANSIPGTKLLLGTACLFLILGGLSVLTGFKTKTGALLLIIFLIPVTLVFHINFADIDQVLQFFKNVGLIGGLLLLIANGGGKHSLSGR